MSEAKTKILKTRVQNKHDIESNWDLANNFKPLAGEIIVYDPDDDHALPRIKVGDGEHYVKQLEFIDAEKADINHGVHVEFTVTEPEMDGAADPGKSLKVARSDHRHPHDTTKVSHEDLAEHASNASHITAEERTAWNEAKTNVANISNTYETKTDATSKLTEAKEYTDTKFNNAYTKSEIDEALAAVNIEVASKINASAVDTKISTHNTATGAHNDIRELISGLATRLNTLANSDDTTLDQMSEVVAYIKNNKSLIDGITTSKVNVADIIDNLTTNVTNKPLSAAQGVAIKGLIDVLQADVDTHTHNYAGSATAGGAATSANKLNTSAGSATNPVYFENGIPVKTTYTLEKSVPADAKFTDTTYSPATSTTSGLTKLYDTTGNNTDGTMTQEAITTAVDTLISYGTTDPTADMTSKFYFKYATD